MRTGTLKLQSYLKRVNGAARVDITHHLIANRVAHLAIDKCQLFERFFDFVGQCDKEQVWGGWRAHWTFGRVVDRWWIGGGSKTATKFAECHQFGVDFIFELSRLLSQSLKSGIKISLMRLKGDLISISLMSVLTLPIEPGTVQVRSVHNTTGRLCRTAKITRRGWC